MKIKRIHIDRFGGLSDFTLEFNNGFNLIFGNNEDGKTTVMSFLRLMFYGEVTKKSDISLNIRRRFTPFSGERMGGEVEFSHQNKNYLLSKQFGKTPRSDRVSLIDTDMGTEVALPQNKEIGEVFFSLGADAFERSIFIGSLPTDGDGSAELSERLRRITFAGESGASFEQVNDRLGKAKLSLRTPRRVGLADKLENEISQLRFELQEAKKAEDKRIENGEKIELLEKEQERKRKLCDELKRTEKRIAERKNLETLRAESELRARFSDCKKTLSGITREQLESSKNTKSTIDKLMSQLSAETANAMAETTDVSDGEMLALLDRLDTLNAEIDNLKKGKDETGKSVLPSVLFTFSALCLVATVVLFLLNVSAYFIALIPFAIFSVFALATLKSSKARKSSSALEAKTRMLSLEEEKRGVNERYIILNERKKIAESANEKIAASKETCKKLQDEINRLQQQIKSELFLSDNQDIESGIDQLSRAFIKYEECEKSILASPFKGLSDDELKEKLSSLSSDNISVTAAECESALLEAENALRDIVSEIERTRAENEVILKSYRSVAVIENEIDEKNDILAKYENHIAALNLATETLNEADSEMRKSFAPELNRMTGEILAGLTSGRHSRVSVSSALGLTVSEDGTLPFAAEHLSAGSFDQAELSLRLAIAKLTGKENNLPLLLDDVLMQYDDGRTKTALGFLLDYAKENQVLLFTCHGSQKELVDSNSVIYMK